MSSEKTLKLMIDNFEIDSNKMRLYKNTLNDRINLNTSMSQILPPQDFSTPWNKLSRDLGLAEDIQMRHENLKRGILGSVVPSPDPSDLLESANMLFENSEKLIDQMNSNSESK